MTEYKSKVKYEPPVELVFDKPIWNEMDRAIEKNVSNINEQVLAASVSACMRVGVKVDKEELIKALRYDRGQYEKGYADGKRDAAPRWHRVEERLPRNGQLVVVIDDDGHANTATLSAAGGWWLSYSNDFFPMSSVLYWMPLPDPPQEVNHEGI